MSDHTPGQWHCIGGAVYKDNTDYPEQPIAFMCRDERATAAGIFPVERDANARLIAAAPELLSACEAIADLANGQGRKNLAHVAGQASIAIAKATGNR